MSDDRRGLAERELVLVAIVQEAVAALTTADLYLDGFVWVTEPEFSELEAIKAASKRVQRLWDEVRGVLGAVEEQEPQK